MKDVWSWVVLFVGAAAGSAALVFAYLWFLLPSTVVPYPVLPGAPLTPPVPVDQGGPAVTLKSVDPSLIATAFKAREVWKVPADARLLLLPHHLMAAREIASLLTSSRAPSRVYLVAPDHFGRGRTSFTVADAPFTFAAGAVMADATVVTRLVDALPKAVTRDAALFTEEPGFAELLALIRTAWDVPVHPVLVRANASAEERAAFAEWMARELRRDPNALFLSSVDFSHDLPAAVADFHDVMAEDVITSLADLEADRVELDSPSALAVLLKTARLLGFGDVTVHAHTNSLRLAQSEQLQEGTSHFMASFAPGAIRAQDTLTVLLFGDLMFDRLVRTRMDASTEANAPFHRLQGKESRFFMGQDLTVGNLECPLTATRRPPEKIIDFACAPNVASLLRSLGFDAVSQANNHALDQGREGVEESRRLLAAAGIAPFGDQVRDDATSATTILSARGQSVAFLGWNTTDNLLDRDAAADAIARAKQSATYTVVMMHWGTEYVARPSSDQTELAHWFIDQGVDAVIGAHPHWVQSLEMYKGKPIAYSLGNSVFDQDWSTETQQGLVAGLVLGANGPALHLFPVNIPESTPVLVTGAERAARLKGLADISDRALSDAIQSGILR